MKTLLYGAALALSATGAHALTITAQELIPTGTSTDHIGFSGAISGNRAVISTQRRSYYNPKHFRGIEATAAYLFDTETGAQIRQLSRIPVGRQSGEYASNDASDRTLFGQSVDMEGDTIVVGAPRTTASYGDGTSFEEGGSAFVLNADDPVVRKVYSPPAPGRYERFGVDLAISGNRAVIREGFAFWEVPSETRDEIYEARRDDTFIIDLDTGEPLTRLDTYNSGIAKLALAFEGNRVITGAVNGVEFWDAQTGERIRKVEIDSNITPIDVDISSGRALVGDITAYVPVQGAFDCGVYCRYRTGAVDIYDIETTEQIGRLLPPGLFFDYLYFGDEVELSDNLAFVKSYTPGTATRSDNRLLDPIANGPPLIYIFDIDTGSMLDYILPPSNDFNLLDASDGRLLVGLNSGGQASAMLYTISQDSVAPVPLPAGLWSLIAGLGALGLLGRRTVRRAD